MPSAKLNAQALQEICQRNLKLYSGAIADILDKGGHRKQVLPRYLTPMTTVNRLAGLAFTGQGYPCASTADDDTQTRLNMLDSITPGTVSVWACGGSVNCAHWGEMMSTAARQRGCTGGVLDGGVRDLDFINVMQYPVFAAFKCAASSVGRWNIKEYQIAIKIGDTVIQPNDFVFGDIDGVVIVPRDNHDAINITKHEVVGLDYRVADLDRDLVFLDVPTPNGTGRALEGGKHRILHYIDEVQVAHAAIEHAAGAAALAGGSGHHLAPVCAVYAAAARPDRYGAGCDAIQHVQAGLRVVIRGAGAGVTLSREGKSGEPIHGGQGSQIMG